LSHGHAKRTGHLTKPARAKYKRRTNRKLEQWIISYLGIEETRNPYTNSRGTITPLQISKLVPNSILRSFDDIQNTMYNMRERGFVT
jgi:hypothetical protein